MLRPSNRMLRPSIHAACTRLDLMPLSGDNQTLNSGNSDYARLPQVKSRCCCGVKRQVVG